MLLLYALDQVEQLKGVADVQDVEMAYWLYVKTLTLGDTAWSAARYTPRHHARSEAAFHRLSELATEAQNEAFLRAADTFNRGRNEYSAQLNSFVS